jgi:hypothetical protein
MTFRLRKAEEADLDFIWRLRVATMKDAISQSYGWDEETQRGYAAESLRGEIVLIDENPVGVLTLADWGDQTHLVWMAILPEMQRQGLGGAPRKFALTPSMRPFGKARQSGQFALPFSEEELVWK